MGWHQYDDGFWGETPEYEPYPDEDPNKPKRSIWDDDQDDNPARDWEYDEDEDPARMPDNPNRGWFGNNERDETAWAQSARGVNSWDLSYRSPYDNTGNNPRYVKPGHSHTDYPETYHKWNRGRQKYRDARNHVSPRWYRKQAKKRAKQKVSSWWWGAK